jgi:hypothetical protein
VLWPPNHLSPVNSYIKSYGTVTVTVVQVHVQQFVADPGVRCHW